MSQEEVRIPAIKVKQWLSLWDDYIYDAEARQSKPQPFFLTCSMPAPLLRRLSGVRRREASGPRILDTAIQRQHDQERSREIERFVESGYPWASLSKRQQDKFPELKKPGWLPTSIIANLVGSETERNGIKANPTDLIKVESNSSNKNMVTLVLPAGSASPDWRPSEGLLEPVEIIDGQHRLYAFSEDEEPDGEFEFPVVFYYDLDISWQAYLFWSINISPKRINPSMAYDLYPLLRTADWLEHTSGPTAYREARAQELTEALWSHEESPWQGRIGMLGREHGKLTQAAFVRSLANSFVRNDRPSGLGGFFGGMARDGASSTVLRWNRAQQAAFLIELWLRLQAAIANKRLKWAKHLRENTSDDETPEGLDPAFAGRYSLLASDHGVRGFLQVCNDLSCKSVDDVGFEKWHQSHVANATDLDKVTEALAELRALPEIFKYLDELAGLMASFDWRSAVTPNLPEDVENFQSRYRAGSGYKQIRVQLMKHIGSHSTSHMARSADAILNLEKTYQE